MNEIFEIWIGDEGGGRIYECEFQRFGYSYRIVVQVNNTEVIFETDEERNFRARVEKADGADHNVAPALIQQIAEALERELK